MGVGPVVAQPGIVGRGEALAACDAALERAREGSGGLLLVAGEPGIGKTTVLQAAAVTARGQGFTVGWAACPEDDAAPAFWPVVRLLAATGHPAGVAAGDELRGEHEDAEQHRFVLFDRVASALRQSAAERPLLLVLDDLHWADPSTLRLLAFLVKQLHTERVLVLASYRDTDVGVGHPMLQLLGEPGTSGETLTLRGLATGEVADLLARTAGGGAPAVAESIRHHTGGNPFFVLHVARLLEAEGRLGAAGAAPLPLPVGVRAVLERRLARLSQSCHELLGSAAVIGARFDLSLLAQVSRLPASAVADLLAESTTARLTQPVDAGMHEFTHALVRATVIAQHPTARRAQLHGRVADALVLRHGDDQERLTAIAHHELSAGAARAASRGVDAADRAGRLALSLRAFEQAAEHFARAIGACDSARRRGELLLALGDARLRSGDWDAALSAFLDAAAVGRALGDADLVARAALGVGADTGGFEVRLRDRQQLDLLEEALTMLGGDRLELRARLLARLSVASTNLAGPAEREAWSDEAVALAREVGEGRTLAYALSAWCDARSGPSYIEDRMAAAAEMLSAGEAAGDRETALMARRFRVVALLELGDPEVDEEIRRFAALADSLAQPLYGWYVPLFRGMRALLHGRLEEADVLCARAGALGAEAGSDNALMLSSTLAGAIGFERGQVEFLRDAFDSALETHEWMRDLPIAIAMAPFLDLCHGRPEQARARLRTLAAQRFASIPVDSEWLSTLAGLALPVLETGERFAAAALYDLLLPHAGRIIVDGIAASCVGPVDYLLGRFALLLGDREHAVSHLEAAAAQARRLSASLLEAQALHGLGTALVATDPGRGRALHREAEEVLRAAGSRSLLVFGLSLEPVTDEPVGARSDRPPETRRGTFRQEGRMWTLGYDGETVHLPDAKGLHDLRHLLSHPGTPVPATALHQAGSEPSGASGHGVDMLDDRARAEYRRRLDDLDDDITEALALGDPERAARAGEERDFLVAELSAAVGLGGRSRRMGDDTERARKAVTMRVRNAVVRIGGVHPRLGRHLSLTVRTGMLCSYEPEEPVEWVV